MMFVLGEKTYLNLDEMRQGIRVAGTGFGGSGGIQEGRVREVTLPEQPHVFPFTAVGETASVCFEWLNAETDKYQEREGNGRLNERK